MPSFRECLESGLDFIEFLGDRISNTSKKELRDIYNSEFKGRYAAETPVYVACVLIKPPVLC